MNWQARVQMMMARSGKSFTEVCRMLGRNGGRKAASNKRKRRAFHVEQVRRRLDCPDNDPIFTAQDQHNIAREANRLRTDL